MIIILIIAVFLAAAVILCGYTIIRFPVRREEGKAHIACVGDSVTYGCTLPFFFLLRYPAILQRSMGNGAQVAVFAVNDRTLQNSGNKPFRKERAYRQSLEFLPETVIILLGTNDSKDANWKSEAAFQQEYRELIAGYRALPSDPRIVICTPACAFKPVSRIFYLTNDAKLQRIPQIARLVEIIAGEEAVELVDLYDLTKERRDLLGPDGLHPSPAGARAIAQEIEKTLKNGSESR